MKPTNIEPDTLDKINQNQHNLSNILSAVVLTLDICESVTDLTPEDFSMIKEELARAMHLLRNNQQIIGQILNQNPDGETTGDDLTPTNTP